MKMKLQAGLGKSVLVIAILWLIVASGITPGAVLTPASAQAQTEVISWNVLGQTINGFGAYDAPESPWLMNWTSAMADFFFGAGSNNMGLTLYRTSIPPFKGAVDLSNR